MIAGLGSSLLKHSMATAVADRNFRTNKVVKLNMREIKSATGFRLPPNKCYQNNVPISVEAYRRDFNCVLQLPD